MRPSQPVLVVGVLAISFGLCPLVPQLPRAHADGDAAAGKAKATACMTCHVAIGDDTPHLVGQRATYIAKQLRAFRAADRKHPVMNGITKFLDDATIDDLAAYWASQPAGSDTALPPEIAAVKKTKMTFPRDFPKGYTLYGIVNKEGQATVAKQYVNSIGLQAVKAGKPMPSGSIIVVENYAAKLDADKKPIMGTDDKWQIDKIKGYEGMEARTGWDKDVPALLLNAPVPNVNWNYALFTADKAPREVNQAVCLGCHVPARDTSFVFSLSRIQDKIKTTK